MATQLASILTIKIFTQRLLPLWRLKDWSEDRCLSDSLVGRMFSISLSSLENRIPLVSLTSFDITDSVFFKQWRNLILGCPRARNFFLAFPDSDDVVAQPLNAWKNLNSKDWSGPKLLAIWWKGINLSDFATPNSIKIYLRVPVDDVRDVFDNLLKDFHYDHTPFAIHLPCPKPKSSLQKITDYFEQKTFWTKFFFFLIIANEWINFFTAYKCMLYYSKYIFIRIA